MLTRGGIAQRRFARRAFEAGIRNRTTGQTAVSVFHFCQRWLPVQRCMLSVSAQTDGPEQVSRTGGDAVVDALVKLGVDRVFGIPGNHNLPIYHALRREDGRICHVTARHEQGVGFMAEGYARSTGRVGVALVITGPGLTNVLTPMASALHDSIPMLVISAQVPDPWLQRPARGYLHYLNNSTAVAASASKASFRIQDPAEISPMLNEAYQLALCGRPGPVHVEIALDRLQSQHSIANCDVAIFSSCRSTTHLSPNMKISLQEAAKRLEGCKQPAIFVGGGSVRASNSILRLAETLNAPVLSTVAGKGVLDERHRLAVGCRVHCPAGLELLQRSDALLLLGTQLSPTDWWTDPMASEVALPRAPETFVVHVDLDPKSLEGSAPANGLAIEADCEDACQVLLTELSSVKADSWGGDPAGIVRKVIADADSVSALAINLGQPEAEVKFMQSALFSLRMALPLNAISAFDMCRPGYAALSLFPTYATRTFIHPVGFGTLGFALPVAIGAAEAVPRQPVMAVLGDGGFQFTLPELAVACERKLPLLLIVWNDRSFGEIRRQLPDDFSTSLPLPDFGHLARAYNLPYFRCPDTKSLDLALTSTSIKQLFDGSGGPCIIEIDRSGYWFDSPQQCAHWQDAEQKSVHEDTSGIRAGLKQIQPYVYAPTVGDVCGTLGIDRITKLSSNENNYAPFPAVTKAVLGELANTGRYPDHDLVSLKAKLAEHLQRTTGAAQKVEPDNFCIVQGAEMGAMLLCSCFLEKGDEVVLTPGYYVHKQASLLHGGTPVDVPLGQDYCIDLPTIAAAVTARTKLVWLTNPHSPLGTLMDASQLHLVLDALKARTGGRGCLVLDEVYSDFCIVPQGLPDTLKLMLDDSEPIISLRSFSKSAGLAGFRIGYIIASASVISAADTASNPFTMSRPALAAANALFEPEGLAMWESTRRVQIRDRKALEDKLQELPETNLTFGNSSTNFVVFETPSMLSQDLAQRLLTSHGIIVRPCGSWGFPNHTRVSVGTTEEMDRFFNALTEVLQQHESHKETLAAGGEAFFASL